MLTIKRNLQVCNGIKSCGTCLQYLPQLADGPVNLQRWAYKHNSERITDMIIACPQGAIEVEGGQEQ